MSRPLSDIERVNLLIDKVVPINGEIVGQVSGILTEPVLRQALDFLQEKYPPLRWKIKDGEVPELVTGDVPKIPIRIVERKDDRHWIEEIEREMCEPFPRSEGPLVRIVQLISPDKNLCELIVSFCHVAKDAKSGIKILTDLLTVAGKLTLGEKLISPKSLPEPLASIDLLIKDLEFAPYPLDDASKNALQTVILNGDMDVPPEKRITRVIPKVLFEDDIKKLVNKCKKEETSIQGAICAVYLQAVVEQIRAQQKVPKRPLPISCLTPVDIRHHFIKPDEEDLGEYISFAIHFQHIDDKASPWPAARVIKEAILTEIKSGKDIEVILKTGEFWKEYSNPVEMVRAINEAYPPVVVTNLGRLDIPERFGKLKLEQLHAAPAISCAARSGLAICVTTFRGRLTLNFLYAAPYISKKRANTIVESTMKRLMEAIKEGRVEG